MMKINFDNFDELKQYRIFKCLLKINYIQAVYDNGKYSLDMGPDFYSKSYKDFSKALQDLITQIWDNLSDEQKKEIVEILK